MSIYTSQIKTHIIDPVYNQSNFRAEYRLEPDTVYLSNFRLINVGATSTGGTAQYGDAVGSQGVIKQISLYDENQLLDQLLESSHYIQFKNLNNTNQDNKNLNMNLSNNFIGNTFTNRNNLATQLGEKINTYDVPQRRGTINTTQTTTNSGWLNLKELFPLLKSMVSVPTTAFKQLKVVVEYHTDPEFYAGNTQRTPYNTLEAQLVVDEVVGEDGKGKLGGFKGVSFTSIEHDRVVVPKVVPTATEIVKVQSQTLHINGFNNKTIGRMLIQKVRVNGSSIIAGKGITGENQRLGMLNDVWGNLSVCPFMTGSGYLETDILNRSALIIDGNNSISNADYYGLNINNKVDDLQIDYERQGIYLYTTDPTNAGNDATAIIEEPLTLTCNTSLLLHTEDVFPK